MAVSYTHLDQMADLLHAAVVMVVLMVMLVVVLALCMAVHRHGDVSAGDAALFRLFPVIGHAGDPQAVEPLHKLLRPGQQLQHCLLYTSKSLKSFL